jgi:hypothetical protein
MERETSFNNRGIDSRGTFLDFLRLFQADLEMNEKRWIIKNKKTYLLA